MALPTTDELLLTAIGLYNNGSLYYNEYDGIATHHLVPTPDPANPTHGIVQLLDGLNPYVGLVLDVY